MKPFWNSLNYALASKIREVMRFYDLSDQSFETDLSVVFSLDTQLELTVV